MTLVPASAAVLAGGRIASAAEPSAKGDEKVASAAGEGKAASSWRTAPADPTDVSETYDCDVLVIGLGHAGSCALRAAAEAGAKVAAFEKAEEGQRVIMGGGQIGHINSEFLKGRGVPEVDVVEFMNDWQVRSNNRSNPGLVMNYAKNCGPCFDWLFDAVDADTLANTQIRCYEEGVTTVFEKELSGLKSWIGTAMTGDYIADALDRCLTVAQDNGGKIFWATTGYKLIQDADGRVTGAYGQATDGTFVQVNAKEVVLAAGGYGANEEMRDDLLWEINQLQEPGCTTSAMMDQDGSGIAMGVWAGGRVDPCSGTMDGGY